MLSEGVAQRANQLMSIVFDADGVAPIEHGKSVARLIAIGIRFVIAGRILLHEGIEVTLARLILISHVEAEVVEGEAKTEGQTVCLLPVGVIGG